MIISFFTQGSLFQNQLSVNPILLHLLLLIFIIIIISINKLLHRIIYKLVFLYYPAFRSTITCVSFKGSFKITSRIEDPLQSEPDGARADYIRTGPDRSLGSGKKEPRNQLSYDEICHINTWRYAIFERTPILIPNIKSNINPTLL